MIGQNSLIQFITGSLSGLITFVILSLSARLFGPQILGIVAYISGVIGLVMAFSDLGLSRAHVHFTAAGNRPETTVPLFLKLKLGLLLLCALTVLLAAWWVKTPWGSIVCLMLGYELLSRVSESILITFEGLQKAWPQNLVRLSARLIKLLAVIILGLRLVSAQGYSLTFVAEATMLFLGSLWLLKSFLPFRQKGKLVKRYWQYALPFLAIVPLSYLQDNGLVVILKQTTSVTQVGFYTAVFGLTGFVKNLYGSVMVFFFPKISSLFAKKDFKSIQHYADMAVKYSLIIFSPLFIGLFLWRKEIVNLVLGQQFLPAVPVFTILLLGTLILMLSAPYDQILYATRNHRPLVWVNLTSLILTVVVSLGLTPIFGALGAAITVTLVWFISGLWHLILVYRKTKIKLNQILFKFIGLGLLTILLTIVFREGTLINAVVLIIYLVGMWLLKLVSGKELNYFFSLIKPK